jgi:ATP-binding cassette subfamily F protein uup
VLVLDEPTNDLDIETLELLEKLVADYPGTIILVSHDRAFVNNVVDGLLVHEGASGFRHYVGNYDDWLRQRKQSSELPSKPATAGAALAKPPKQPRVTKLGYKDQRELYRLPQDIEALEARIGELYAEMNDPTFFQQPPEAIKAAQERLAELETALEQTYTRWEELESIQTDLRARA